MLVLVLCRFSLRAAASLRGNVAGLPQEFVSLDLTASVALRTDIETADAPDRGHSQVGQSSQNYRNPRDDQTEKQYEELDMCPGRLATTDALLEVAPSCASCNF